VRVRVRVRVRGLFTDESEALELHGLSPGLEVAEEEVLRLLGRLESHLGPAAPAEPDHVQRVHLVMARQLLDVAAEMASGVRVCAVVRVRHWRTHQTKRPMPEAKPCMMTSGLPLPEVRVLIC